MGKINWVTIFHGYIGEVNINKAEVQIPLNLKRQHNIDVSIYSVKSKKLNEYQGSKDIKEHEGIKFGYFSNKNIFNIKLGIISFLFKESKNIDILHVPHITIPNIIYGLLYKFLNKSGKLYIMMDLDPKPIKTESFLSFKSPFLRLVLGKIIYNSIGYFIKKCSCISIETRLGYDFLIKYNPNFAKKLIYVPNGFDEKEMKNTISMIKTFDEKENILITVGRIGSYTKNTEMLLEAIEKINLKNWKIYIVGPIEEYFKSYINSFLSRNPHLKEVVLFTGPIYEKKELYALYNRSKIFCFTSRNESFGIVNIESMYFNNFVVMTDIASADDITNNGSLGFIIPRNDTKELSEKLTYLINNESFISDKMKNNQIHDFAVKKFSRSRTVDAIWQKLYNQ